MSSEVRPSCRSPSRLPSSAVTGLVLDPMQHNVRDDEDRGRYNARHREASADEASDGADAPQRGRRVQALDAEAIPDDYPAAEKPDAHGDLADCSDNVGGRCRILGEDDIGRRAHRDERAGMGTCNMATPAAFEPDAGSQESCKTKLEARIDRKRDHESSEGPHQPGR